MLLQLPLAAMVQMDDIIGCRPTEGFCDLAKPFWACPNCQFGFKKRMSITLMRKAVESGLLFKPYSKG